MTRGRAVLWARCGDVSKRPQLLVDKRRVLQTSVPRLRDEKLSLTLRDEKKPTVFP